jgi:hypothetical protein
MTNHLPDGYVVVAPIEPVGLHDPDHAVVEGIPEMSSSSSFTTTDR